MAVKKDNRSGSTRKPPQTTKSNEELRREHRAQRQRQQKKRRRVFYVTLCVIVLIIGVVLSLTVFFNAKSIDVSGDNFYTKEEIIAASGIQPGDNLILLKEEDVQKKISEKLPFIGEIELKTSFPDKLTIVIKSTTVKCAIEYNKSYVLIDENGKVLATVASLEELQKDSTQSGKVPTFTSGQGTKPAQTTTQKAKETATTKVTATTTTTKAPESTTAAPTTTAVEKKKYILGKEKVIILKGIKVKSALPGKHLETANEKTFELYKQIMDYLGQNKISGITEMNLADSVNISLMYQGRIELKIGTVSNLDDKFALAANVLKNQDEVSPYQKGTIDLTIDKKAYFTPQAETTAPATTVPVTTASTTDTQVTTKASTTTTTKKAG